MRVWLVRGSNPLHSAKLYIINTKTKTKNKKNMKTLQQYKLEQQLRSLQSIDLRQFNSGGHNKNSGYKLEVQTKIKKIKKLLKQYK